MYHYAPMGEIGGLKSILKKVVTGVSVIAAPFTGGSSLAVGAAVNSQLKSKGGKVPADEISGKAVGSVPYATMNLEQLVTEIQRLQAMIAQGKDVKDVQAKLIKANAYYNAGGAPTIPGLNPGSKSAGTSPVFPDSFDLDEVVISATRPSFLIPAGLGVLVLVLLMNSKKARK